MKVYNSEYSGGQIRVLQAHQFIAYREMFPLYDRAAPFAADFFDSQHLLDLGANIGDSLVDFVKSRGREIYCVEGDKNFFSHLESNIEYLSQQGFKSNRAYNFIIGEGKKYIHSKNGSGVAIECDTAEHAVPIMQLLEVLGTSPDFIKCDFDGYDAEALYPAMLEIRRTRPVIFFECDYQNLRQRLYYQEFLDSLFSIGASVIFFDNFGTPYGLVRDSSQVSVLFDSLDFQRKFPGGPKIFYYDALVVWDGIVGNMFLREFKRRFFDSL